uniref:chitin synthase n=1 Tax=Spongospora subterranea TaxID=70186 RepID=A0A0H5QWF1_9EUKA|eukprot:CRZ05961.1 hypothetical protein [Spongospora subterranea]
MSNSDLSDNDYRSRRRGNNNVPGSSSRFNLEVRAPTAADLNPVDPNQITSPSSQSFSSSDLSSPSAIAPINRFSSNHGRYSPYGASAYSSRSVASAITSSSAPVGIRSYASGPAHAPSLISSLATGRIDSLKTKQSSGGTRSLVSSSNPYGVKEVVQYLTAADVMSDDEVSGPDKTSEFEMRYTSVECDADHFAANYSLRTMENGRNIKVFIVVTMYNEDTDELKRTLKGIIRNIETFIEELGEDAWKEICMCIVADGRHKADKGSLDYLEELRIYDANQMHAALDKSQTIRMHLFESTLLIPSENMSGPAQPLQTIFALKERNGGKLDSHHWFFNAFSAQIQPTYCFMFDVGTKPEHSAILKLYDAMEADQEIGGCCGEITTRVTASINPWIAAQQFEYKIATILEKSMESVFGFISVLPGAFSAYRYAAIVGEPLNQYFKQINTDIVQISPFKGNMYLAEDRILCFEVLAEKNCKWTLKYVKDAKAATDVPESLTDLIKQRRRWLNGSLFAMIYAIGNFRKFANNSAHSRMRKSFISMQFWFHSINIILQWFLLANFYLMFEFAVSANQMEGNMEVKVFRALFLILTLVQCVAGLGNRPDELPMIYFFCAVGYGVFFFYVLAINVRLLFRTQDYSQYPDQASADAKRTEVLYAQVASLCGLAVYFSAGLLHGQLFAICISIIQYFFMLPMFLIGFPIYSFCNIHDISWGTKGLENNDMAEGATRKQKEIHAQVLAKRKTDLESVDARFRTFRSNMVIGWLASNALFIEIISKLGDIHEKYIYGSYIVFFALNMFKFFFCTIFVIQETMKSCVSKKKEHRKGKRTTNEKKVDVAAVQEPMAIPPIHPDTSEVIPSKAEVDISCP